MIWILATIGAVIILVAVSTLTLRLALKKSSQESWSSRYILNKVEPDNTAPTIEELIEFCKNSENVKYSID